MCDVYPTTRILLTQALIDEHQLTLIDEPGAGTVNWHWPHGDVSVDMDTLRYLGATQRVSLPAKVAAAARQAYIAEHGVIENVPMNVFWADNYMERVKAGEIRAELLGKPIKRLDRSIDYFKVNGVAQTIHSSTGNRETGNIAFGDDFPDWIGGDARVDIIEVKPE